MLTTLPARGGRRGLAKAAACSSINSPIRWTCSNGCSECRCEFARIADNTDLKEFAGASGATVVLKGPVTRICGRVASPGPVDQELSPPVSDAAETLTFHSFFGGPVLARGGSGDLLAGLIGGLLAQAPTEPLLAACRGVVWHGLAADCLARAQGQTTVQVTQLLDFLLPALRVAAKTE